MGGTGLRRLCAFLSGRGGSVSPMLALMLVPMIGALSMAAEASNWYLTQRAAQNAADAAVMAAASNNSTGTPSYSQEAAAVAAKYNFVDGTNNATVAASIPASCPSGMPTGATSCYQVTITKKIPISLTQVLGYHGNTTIGSANAVLITATAIASAPLPEGDCIITKQSFQTNGSPKFNAAGCYLYAGGGATCNGSGGLTGLGFAGGYIDGTDKKCNGTDVTTPPPDPFANQMTNYPPTGCTKTAGGTLPATLAISGCREYTSAITVPATGTTVTTGTGGGILMVDAGASITLNGTLNAAFGNGLTIIFNGASGGAAGFFAGSGTVDFGAPTTGNWSGIAVYQNPVQTTPTSPTYSGSSPTFNITGLIYAPYANMTFSGAINHESGGYACIAFILDSLLINGTGSIFNNPTSQCYKAGLNGLPTAPNSVAVRQALVQ